MDELIAVLGCPLEAPAVERLCLRHGLVRGTAGARISLENPAAGVALGASEDGLVDAVFLFGNVKDGFREYRGPLPRGLTFACRRGEVRAEFGPAAAVGEPAAPGQAAVVHGGWDRYELRDYLLHFTYAAHTGFVELVTLMPPHHGPGTSVVQPAAIADLPEIAALAARVWRSHYPRIISPEQIQHMLSRMYDPAVLEREVREQGVRYECLYRSGALIAFASWGPVPAAAGGADEPPRARLHKLYVDGDHQRRGHGRRLLDQVEALARARGARRLTLNVNKRNAPAIAAYERCGWRITAGTIDDIGGGFVMDDWIMEKSL